MRKRAAILLILVLLLSAARFTIAIHFCNDKVIDTKVTLSGKLSSCGMGSSENNSALSGNNLKAHCCYNQIMTLGISNIFTKSVAASVKKFENLQKILFPSASQLYHSDIIPNNICTSISPPGRLTTSSVSLDNICVFRI
jgi:hypothetical protein